MAGDRKRASSNTIDVPATHHTSRKRRPSYLEDETKIDDCHAAFILMSLSGSPSGYSSYWGGTSPEGTDSSSFRSTPSPETLLEYPSGSFSSVGTNRSSYDSGIGMEPRKKQRTDSPSGFDSFDSWGDASEKRNNGESRKKVYSCTYPGCYERCYSKKDISAHLKLHKEVEEGYEEFYYTTNYDEDSPQSTQHPTFMHRDLARPPHEDPEYQRQIVANFRQQQTAAAAAAAAAAVTIRAPKSPKISGQVVSPGGVAVVGRPSRGIVKKCRKTFGMEKKGEWCTQCRWKKACSRFTSEVPSK